MLKFHQTYFSKFGTAPHNPNHHIGVYMVHCSVNHLTGIEQPELHGKWTNHTLHWTKFQCIMMMMKVQCVPEGIWERRPKLSE